MPLTSLSQPISISYRGGSPLETAPNLRTHEALVHEFNNPGDTEPDQRTTARDRMLLIDRAIFVLHHFFVHLAQAELRDYKRKIPPPVFSRNDPLLQLLELRSKSELATWDNWTFTRYFSAIFQGLSDWHTRYLLMSHFRFFIGFLPFLVEGYTDRSKRFRLLVTHRVNDFIVPDIIIDGIATPVVDVGYEVVEIGNHRADGEIEMMPTAQWLIQAIQGNSGVNENSARAQAVDSIVYRPLAMGLPDANENERWITLKTPKGERIEEIKFPWTYAREHELAQALAGGKTHAVNKLKSLYGCDQYHTSIVGRIRNRLFARDPQSAQFQAFPLNEHEGIFYLRIFEFPSLREANTEAFLKEIEDKLGDYEPKMTGVIIDIRGNRGGRIDAAERLLQFFSKRPIRPMTARFRNSPANWIYCDAISKLEANSAWSSQTHEKWRDSISRRRHARYSDHFGMTNPDLCNQKDRLHLAVPSVVITDALTFSAGEVFAAGFRDNGIGKIIGVDQYTAGGGANAIETSNLFDMLKEFDALPAEEVSDLFDTFDGTFLVAIRVLRRIAGHFRYFEGYGVRCNRLVRLTKRDLQENNRDLIKHAVAILHESRKRS